MVERPIDSIMIGKSGIMIGNRGNKIGLADILGRIKRKK